MDNNGSNLFFFQTLNYMFTTLVFRTNILVLYNVLAYSKMISIDLIFSSFHYSFRNYWNHSEYQYLPLISC